MLREVPATDSGQGYHSRYQRDDRRDQQNAVQAGGEGGPGDRSRDLPGGRRRWDPGSEPGRCGEGRRLADVAARGERGADEQGTLSDRGELSASQFGVDQEAERI